MLNNMALRILMLLLVTESARAEYPLNLTQGVTPISREVYDLHMIILIIVTVIGVAVFAVMFWSIFHHRKSKGAVAQQFHHNTYVEIIWTIIPIVILVVMAVPATKTLIKMEQTSDPDMTIKVTGYQWKWKYDYVEDGVSFLARSPRTLITPAKNWKGIRMHWNIIWWTLIIRWCSRLIKRCVF